MAEDREAMEAVAGLRQMAIDAGLEKPGFNGLLMESHMEEAVFTLVALPDAVSFYYSNGGGQIGLGEHPGPKRERDKLLKLAQEYVTSAAPVSEAPLPGTLKTQFYFLSADGLRKIEGETDAFGYNRLPASPLFHQAHELIAECMHIMQSQR